MAQSNGWRTSPLYTISEAAQLAKTTSGTIKRWLFGADGYEPLFDGVGTETHDSTMVSFIQLVEIVVAKNFRQKGRVSLCVVRKAYENAKRELDVKYPFASLKLESLAGHIILQMLGAKAHEGLPAMDAPGLTTIPGLTIEVLKDFEYESELATRWWPLGKDCPIVIDPRFSAGVPTVPERRVTIGNIRKRWLAGQTMRFISKDLALEEATVEEVLRYGESIAA